MVCGGSKLTRVPGLSTSSGPGYKESKYRSVASDIFIYIDDGRPTGHPEECFLQAPSRWRLVCTHLVIQDASLKVEEPY